MLTNKQKFILSDLSRQAWAKALAASGQHEDDFLSADDFRHQEVARAVGKHGLRCCGQMDYKAIEGHFYTLLGAVPAAFNAHVRSATEPRRQAEAVLHENLQKFGLPTSYAEAICRRQYKCSLVEASIQQLWRLIYTIRNRGNRKTGVPVRPKAPEGKGKTYILKPF